MYIQKEIYNQEKYFDEEEAEKEMNKVSEYNGEQDY